MGASSNEPAWMPDFISSLRPFISALYPERSLRLILRCGRMWIELPTANIERPALSESNTLLSSVLPPLCTSTSANGLGGLVFANLYSLTKQYSFQLMIWGQLAAATRVAPSLVQRDGEGALIGLLGGRYCFAAARMLHADPSTYP